MDRKVETPAQPRMGDAGESLDKVRDILFGAQAREFENRFAQLEAELLQQTNEAREDAHRRLEALEVQLKQEARQLMDRIKAENAERNETIKVLSNELKQLTKQLDQKIHQLDDKSTKGQNELRQQLLTQAKSLSEEIKQRSETLTTNLDSGVATLTQEKVSRVDIASIFTEMAKRFAGEKAN